jgi:hypothetical protein
MGKLRFMLHLTSRAAFMAILMPFALHAQSPFTWSPSAGPAVLDGGTPLDHPFTGGLTAPQWSGIDFDLDGDEDLFAFDRDGERVLLFEKLPDGRLVERLDWELGWPDLKHWVLLRDYDCDGLPDLFTGFQNAVHVYRNVMTASTAGTPSFELVAQPLLAQWDFGTGAEALSLLCLTIDKPAIGDFNGDGALDLVTFTETSSTLYAFMGQTPCALDFECTNRCYGMWNEGFEDNSVFIGDDHSCSFNVADPRTTEHVTGGGYRHAGGTVTLLHLDDETPLPDLLIGDVSYPFLAALTLEDAADGQDSTAFADMHFPSLLPHAGAQDTLNLSRFPAAYPWDYDSDGIQDLVVSPNTHIETNDDASVHVWKNSGTPLSPIWEWVTDRFLQDQMIDVGRGAAPVFADLDGDGLTDLAIANKERYQGVANTPADLALLRNVGTATEPAFQLMTWGAIDFVLNNIESIYPAFADLDNDGDLDLLVGDELGLLHRFDNMAGPGNWPEYVLNELAIHDADGNTIDVGQFATPQFMDLQNDGALELVVGHKNGTLKVFTACEGSWCPEGDWAGIQVDNQFGIEGYSIPALYSDGADVHVFAGNETGTVQYFGIVDPEDWTANLPLLLNEVGGYQPGLKAAPALADLNSDGLPELAIGIQNGGVRFYASGPMGADYVHDQMESFALFPNPGSAASRTHLRKLSGTGDAGTLEIFSAVGELIWSEFMPSNWTSKMLIQGKPGLYLVRFTPETKTGTASAAPVSFRWIIQQQ